MIALYVPGTSIVHRAPASAKLAFVTAGAVALSLAPQNGWVTGAALLAAAALYGVARLPLRVLAAEVWRIRAILSVLAAALWIFSGPLAAWITTSRVACIVLLAGLLTLTTRMADLLAVLRRLLAPLRRAGADVEAVAMTIALSIAMVPVVTGFAHQVREAQQSRGLRPGLGWVVPLMVRTLRHADDVGEALIARRLVEPDAGITGDRRRACSRSATAGRPERRRVGARRASPPRPRER